MRTRASREQLETVMLELFGKDPRGTLHALRRLI